MGSKIDALTAKVEAQQDQIVALEGRLDTLETKIDSLAATVDKLVRSLSAPSPPSPTGLAKLPKLAPFTGKPGDPNYQTPHDFLEVIDYEYATYNDIDRVHVAGKCLTGPARVWFAQFMARRSPPSGVLGDVRSSPVRWTEFCPAFLNHHLGSTWAATAYDSLSTSKQGYDALRPYADTYINQCMRLERAHDPAFAPPSREQLVQQFFASMHPRVKKALSQFRVEFRSVEEIVLKAELLHVAGPAPSGGPGPPVRGSASNDHAGGASSGGVHAPRPHDGRGTTTAVAYSARPNGDIVEWHTTDTSGVDVPWDDEEPI